MSQKRSLSHPNQLDLERDKTLWSGITSGDENLVRKTLIKYRSSLDSLSQPSSLKESPYILAMKYHNEHLIPILSEYRIDVNSPNLKGQVPVVEAAKTGNISTVAILLENGADPNVCDIYKENALYWAVHRKKYDMIDLLMSYNANINMQIAGSTALHCAASYRDNITMVQKLVSHNASVNAGDNQGNTPLFKTVMVNDYELTSYLIQNGAVINIVNSEYRSPLHIAAASVHQSTDITQLLLQNGALVNVPDRYRNIPLVLSLKNLVLHANIKVAECLVKHGSELNSEESCEALEWSVIAHGNFDLVKLAVHAGFELRGVRWVSEFINDSPGRKRWYTTTKYDVEKEEQFRDFLKNYVTKAVSLAESCRMVIRRYLIKVSNGSSILYRIEKLPLPKPLIDYLNIVELE